MEHPVWDFHVELKYRNAKKPASAEAGFSGDQLRGNQSVFERSGYRFA
jgi:hypothetical protein